MSMLAALLLADLVLRQCSFIVTSFHGVARVQGELRNNGTAPVAAELVVSLPPGAHFLDVRDNWFSKFWTCSDHGNKVVCTNPAVAPREDFTFDIGVSMDDASGKVTAVPVVLRTATETRTGTIPVMWRKPIRVTSSEDEGAGTLREAIRELNSTCSGELLCDVLFDLPMPATIAPRTPLPPITACGWIMNPNDDLSSPRDADRRITLSGANVSSGSGLVIRTTCSISSNAYTGSNVEGFAIGGFPQNGILITSSPSTQLSISAVSLGTDATGNVARPNGGRGVMTEGGSGAVTISRSIVSGNTRSGIFLDAPMSVIARDMRIGVARDGSALGNGASGVYVGRGRFSIDERSEIANHPDFGVAIQAGTTTAVDASVHSNGVQAIDRGLDGPTPVSNDWQPISTPVITDAHYDAAKNETVITVDVALRGWLFAFVSLYANRTYDASGRAEMERYLTSGVKSYYTIPPDLTWRIRGDLRGEIITAVAQFDPWGDAPRELRYQSEVSEGVPVH